MMMALRPLSRPGAVAIILSLTAAGATAFAKDIRMNEFRAAGRGLVCVTRDAALHSPPHLSCLRIGPVRIGQSAAKIRRMFGQPYRVLRRNGREIRVYVADTQTNPTPYWVIYLDGNRVVGIQLTGRSEKTGISFSSIRLGDRARRVREILGKPAHTRPVKEIGGTLWSYRPFPVSIEIKDGRVYSMKVWRK